MNWRDHISSDPAILFGKPIVKNTRIPVDLILEKLGHGATYTDLLEAYPRLKNDDILACLLFASDNSKHEKTLAVA